LTIIRRGSVELEVAEGDAVEDVEEAMELGGGIGYVCSWLDRGDECAEAVKVSLVSGFDYVTKQDNKGDKGGEQ
jgi:hypothetical protein